jgi:hypothetical protein
VPAASSPTPGIDAQRAVRNALRAFLVLLIPTAVVVAQSGQPPARDRAADVQVNTALVTGTVTAADTGQPLPGVRVLLSATTAPLTRSAVTDPRGRFEFEALPAGTYRLSASRSGYVDSVWGQKQPGSGRPGTSLQLRDGQHVKDLTLPLAKGGVVTGLIMDEFGYPAAGTAVRVYRSIFRNGERVLQQVGSGQADDRGVYRVYGLVPGDYIVVATPRTAAGTAELVRVEAEKAAMVGERYALVAEKLAELQRGAGGGAGSDEPASGYAPVFYPGTTTAASATRVTLGASEEKSGIDFGLQVVPLSRISGTVTGVAPLPATLTVYLTEQGPLTAIGSRTTRVAPDGRFSLSGVPPGQYSLTVRAALRPAVVAVSSPADETKERAVRVDAQPQQWMWAQTDVSVGGGPIGDVTLVLAQGMSITGTVTFSGGATPPDLSRVRLSFLPIGGSASAAEMELGSAGARVDAQGRFTAVGLMPGRYRVTAAAVPGWTLSSVTAQGREALDFPIELTGGEDVTGVVATFSDRKTTLNGTLQAVDGTPAPDYTVVVFAADSRFWTPFSRRVQAVRPASDGRYTFSDLPEGDYRIAAVVDPEPGQWSDPEFLRALVNASTPISLNAGDSRTQDLRIGR